MEDRIGMLRRGYEAWNLGDFDTLLELCHPAIEIRPWIGAVLGDAEYLGHEGARRLFDDDRRAWDQFEIRADDFIQRGEAVVVPVYVRLRPKGQSFVIDGDIAHVVRFRDGLVVGLEGFADRESALASLG